MLQDYFHFTRLERNGVICLLFAILLCLFAPKIYPTLFPRTNELNYSALKPFIAKWDSLQPTNDSIEQRLFVFNPNTVSRYELLQLGLSQKVANNLINFRKKVRPFSRKEDLKKVWDFKEEDYIRLESYINFSQEESQARALAKPSKQSELFDFDPNTVTKSQLLKLGLSKKAANNLINYREKGAKFFKKADFKKIWGVTPDDYARLEPYIITAPFASNEIPQSYNKNLDLRVNVNSATSEEFQKLNGIGQKTADRIVKFRNALGGFISIEQVGDTWGFQKETFYNLKPQFIITTENIKQINLNTATVDELRSHPYFKWREANTIVEYRTQNGDFKSVQDIREIKIIDGVLFSKVEPYLAIE
ncbi:MAG: helix-hairpin-helix domain-containing protein [Saprospiraceae bacterium]